jgi:alkane 1-monooxygenase
MKYLRYLCLPILVVIGIYFAAKGQYWAWLYLLLLDSIIIGGDAFLGDDRSTPKYQYPSILTALLFINLPLIFLLVCIATYMAGDLSSPMLEQTVLALTGLDIAVTRNGTELWHLAGYVFAGGLLVGSAATVPGHELVHHKKKPLDWFMGNWMMAFTWDSAFAIEHVQGHHKNVGLPSDPATAKRGDGLYKFFIRSSIQEHRDAWQIEGARLKKRSQYFLSYHNQILNIR